MKNKGIIFDIDGTIWDSTKGVLESWNKVLDRYEEVGYQMTMEQLHSYMGKVLEEIGGLFMPHIDAKKRLEILQEAVEEEISYLYQHPGKLYDGIEEVFSELTKEYSLYIISNCQDGYIELLLDLFDFHDYFTDCECSGRTGKGKGDNIKIVMERNHLDQAIYIGDTQGDLDATKEAQIPFIFAKYGFGKIDEDRLSIDTPVELIPLVHELLG